MVDRLPPIDGPSKPSKLARTALVVSLAVNVAVVCAFIGFLLAGRPPGGGGPRGFEIGIGPLAAALDPADRRDIRERLQRNGGLRPLSRIEARGLQLDLIELLRSDAFDPSEVDALFSTLRGRTYELQQAAQEALVEKIASMSLEERAEFADRVEAEIDRPRRRPKP